MNVQRQAKRAEDQTQNTDVLLLLLLLLLSCVLALRFASSFSLSLYPITVCCLPFLVCFWGVLLLLLLLLWWWCVCVCVCFWVVCLVLV